LSQPAYISSVPLTERLRNGLGRRATGVVVTLLLEALLVLAIWSLGQSNEPPKFKGELVSTFDAAPDAEEPEQKKQDEPKPTAQRPAETAQPVTQPLPTPPQPALPTPPSIPLSPKQAPAASPAPKGPPVAPGAPAYGPPNTGNPGDSKRVGTAPNGEPLYQASWYRKPYDSELSGYLSTAEGPGWGLIACKTAPDFRVEDCVLLDENPDNSNIGRAVLAAAWQFKVRPPRIGGRSIIGAWVRIRITYDIKYVQAE